MRDVGKDASGASLVVVLLGLGIALLTTAHIVNAVTLRSPVLDMDVENNVPTWYSSSLFLLAALAGAGAGITADGARARVAWLAVAFLAAASSLDETASLHEVAGTRIGAEPTLSLTQPVAALVVAAFLLIVARLVTDAARPVLVLTALAVVAAQAAASIGGLATTGLTRRGIETVEDALEMTVGLLLLISALRGVGHTVSPRHAQLRREWAALRPAVERW